MSKQSHQTPQIIPGLGVDLPELRRARTLWGMNRTDEALDLFETAVRKHPQNLVALVDASRALGARFEIQRAEPMLDRMMKLGQHRPDILHLAGQSYRMVFRPDKAIACFQRVLTLTKQIPDAYLELAVLYERRHRVSEAFDLVEDCLRAVPDYFEAQLFKARLLRRLKDESTSESLFRRLATDPQVHPEVQAQAWADVAQLHDRRQEYELAMAAMLKSKQILAQREGSLFLGAETVMNHLKQLTESLEAAHLKRWTDSAPSFSATRVSVLTGFPRSGTTLLEQVLDAHPGLVSSDEREAFARDIFPAMWLTPETPVPSPAVLDAIPSDRLERLRARYLSYMVSALNAPLSGRVHLDKNPTLTVVLPGFVRLFPESRIIVALRDPRDVVLSCFMQYLPLNSNSVYFLSLERAARRYANDLSLWLTLRQKLPVPWLEVRYEQTVTALEQQARHTLAFLDLPWDPAVLNYREGLQAKAVASPTYEAVSQPLYTRSIGRWKHYQKFLEPSLAVLQPMVEAFGYD